MTDTVTKEQVEAAADKVAFGNASKADLIAELFPPKFQPREGQVIAVWDDNKQSPSVDYFIEINADSNYPYLCRYSAWKNARPLTVEEIT